MSAACDFLRKPDAYYVLAVQQPPLFAQPCITVNLVQYVPWNEPQSPRHFSTLKLYQQAYQRRAGLAPYLHIADRFNDPDLGLIWNNIIYSGIRRDPKAPVSLPSFADAESVFDIRNVISIQWNKPEPRQIARLTEKHNCAGFAQEKAFYSLFEKEDRRVQLGVTVVRQLPEVSWPESESLPQSKPFLKPAADGKREPPLYARDPVFGDVELVVVTTAEADTFQGMCGIVQSVHGKKPAEVWIEGADEVVLPGFKYLFDQRPTRDQVTEQKRLLDIFNQPQDGPLN